MTADLVVTNARVRTMAPGSASAPMPEAVAVTDGRIALVGSDREVRELTGPRTVVVDARGGVVVPGLTDSHCHVVQGALMAMGVDLSGCSSLDEVRGRLSAAEPDATGWIRGFGLDHNVYGASPVTAEPLEPALRGAPAVIRLYDAHSTLVSAEAMRRAGLTGREQVPAPARVAVDAEGRPTGHLVEEAAMALVEAPVVSGADRVEALRQVTSRMAAVGLTGGHVMDDLPGTLEALRDVDDQDGLRWRVYGWLRPGDGADVIDRLTLQSGERGRLWRGVGVKSFVDGTVEGGTAWLHDADAMGASRASYWPDPQAWTRAVLDLAQAGVRTATHAIGDAAVDHVLATLATTPDPSRHRIEHLETVLPATVRAIADAGIVTSMQPTHCTRCTRADGGDQWSTLLGAERVARGWPWGDLRRFGAVVAFGSDWPVAHFDPRTIMADAQLRRPVEDHDDRPRQPGQEVSALEALEGYTVHAAAAVDEHDAGAVRVGGLGDLTVLADDPVTVSPDELAELPVVATIVAGRLVHHA